MARNVCIVAAAIVMSVVYLPAQTSSWRPTIVAQHGMVAAGHPLAAEAGHAHPQSRRQRDRRRDGHVGGAGRSRAGHDRPRRRHVHPVLRREDARGEVHQRHRLRAAGRDDRALQEQRRHPRRWRRCRSRCRARSAAPRYAVQEVRHQTAGRGARAGDRDRRQRLPDHRRRSRVGLDGSRDKLAKFPSTTKIWFKDGKPLEMGDIARQQGSRAHAAAIAAQGADPFYRGDDRQEHGGVPEGERRPHHRSRSGRLSGRSRTRRSASTIAASTSTSARRTRRAS